MGSWDYEDLKRHVGHKIECVTYGEGPNDQSPANVAVECETCNEVLLDYDRPEGRKSLVRKLADFPIFVTEVQKSAIRHLAKMKDYTITENLDTMSYAKAAELIKKLNKMERDSEDIT